MLSSPSLGVLAGGGLGGGEISDVISEEPPPYPSPGEYAEGGEMLAPRSELSNLLRHYHSPSFLNRLRAAARNAAPA